MPDLPGDLYHRIVALCGEGDAVADAGDLSGALVMYWAAWDLLPEPRFQWEAATWILAAVGDMNCQSGDFQAARDNLSTAMHCPKAIGNPFLHLRLGQSRYELGELDGAADELTRAYMGAGADIFEGESSKYFEFLKTRLSPPRSGW